MRGLLWRITGVLGCLILIALVVAVVGGAAAVDLWFERQEPAPADAVRNYLRAVDDDDFRAAHERLCGELKERYTPATLRPYMARLLDEIGGHLGSWSVDDFPYPRANGRFGIYFEAQGVKLTPRRYQVLVAREDRAWRLCGFER